MTPSFLVNRQSSGKAEGQIVPKITSGVMLPLWCKMLLFRWVGFVFELILMGVSIGVGVRV